MNTDQPKPTCEPAGAASEWTIYTLSQFYVNGELQVLDLLDAINAALTTEREAGVKALAERSFELHECQKQLAAERSKSELAEYQWKEVSKQLAAERSKVQTLVDALKLIADKYDGEGVQAESIAKNALAKWKEGASGG